MSISCDYSCDCSPPLVRNSVLVSEAFALAKNSIPKEVPCFFGGCSERLVTINPSCQSSAPCVALLYKYVLLTSSMSGHADFTVLCRLLHGYNASEQIWQLLPLCVVARGKMERSFTIFPSANGWITSTELDSVLRASRKVGLALQATKVQRIGGETHLPVCFVRGEPCCSHQQDFHRLQLFIPVLQLRGPRDHYHEMV